MIKMKERFNVKKIFTKKIIIYFLVMVIDIVLTIYCARRNILNYVTINDKEIIVGGTKKLFFGRNYITIVITLFFYGYICLVNRFVFKERRREKFYVLWFLVLILINVLLFSLFSRKIY